MINQDQVFVSVLSVRQNQVSRVVNQAQVFVSD